MIKEEIRGIYMNKKKFFLLPICLLLLGACNTAHASSTPVEDSNVTSQSAVDPDHKHVYGDWVQTKAPTCTEKGEEEQVCACGDKKTRTVNALGHDWGEWTVKTAATCTVDGVEERACKRAGCNEKETRPITAEHEWDAEQNVPSGGEGQVAYTIAQCKKGDGIKADIKAIDGTFVAGENKTSLAGYVKIKENNGKISWKFTVPGTKNYVGMLYQKGVCSSWSSNSNKCYANTSSSSSSVKDLERGNFEVKVNGVAVDKSAWIETPYTELLAEGEDSSALGSDLSPICLAPIGQVSVNAGVNEITYERLGSYNLTISDLVFIGSEHTHEYGEWQHTKEPTCTEDGLDERVCSKCGLKESYVVAALGHDWDAGEVTTRPTKDADGVKTYTCKRFGCGATQTEVLPKVDGYAVTFVPGEHCKVLVYSTKNYANETPVETNSCYAKDENGLIVEYDLEDAMLQPQVSFKVVCDEGYSVNKTDIAVTGVYKNLKQDPDSTGATDIFRITKVQTNLTINITPVASSGVQNPGNPVNLITNHCSVKVYVGPKDDTGSNVDEGPNYYSRSKDAPYGHTLNAGQFNFEVIPDAGYKFVSGIEVGSELAGAAFVTGDFNKVVRSAENVYRITKINGEISIKIRCIPEAGEEGLGYEVTFVTEHCKVMVYDDQNYNFKPAELVNGKALTRTSSGDAAKYVADNPDTADIDEEVKPQINFIVVCDEGYEFNSGVAVGSSEKASKISFITGDFNKFENVGEGIYKVTKIKGDLTITISATAVSA